MNPNKSEGETLKTETTPQPRIPDHTLLRRVGQGGYGEVWLAQNVMGTYRAVKIIYRKTFSNDQLYEREFSGIQKFEPISRTHPGLVTILHMGRNDQAGYFFYIMEVADEANVAPAASVPVLLAVRPAGSGEGKKPSPELAAGISPQFADKLTALPINPDTYTPKMLSSEIKKRGKLPFEESLEISLSLTSALGHLHQHGLVHRDIKPSNIIFVNGVPKIADIGLVTEIGEAVSYVGTRGYIPPEGPGSPTADLYSLGKVLYQVSTGRIRQESELAPMNLEEASTAPELLRLTGIILKACDENVQKRFRSAGEMHTALLKLRGGDREPQSHDGTQRHKLTALVFTELVRSSPLLPALGDREAMALLQRHHAAVRDLLSRFPDGEEIRSAGDSFLLVFVNPSDAVKFSLLFQARLRALAKETRRPVLDRIGIHVGEVLREAGEGSKELHGMAVDICARVMSLAEGDQILMTRSAFDNSRQVLKGEDIEGVNSLSWLNHGPYRLEGVEEAMEICEVGELNGAVLKPPPDSEKVRRFESPEAEPVLGWRPALGQVVPNTKWVLELKLGEGGFGEVWLGRHQTMKERRVFKFCFRADRVRSLKREMTLFRLLKERVGDHPNIVRLLEVYLDHPPFYVEMDYVEGRDLKSWSEERGGVASVPLEARLEIVAQIADALQAAHEAGVIHRDVKPTNILVSFGVPPSSGSAHELPARSGLEHTGPAEAGTPNKPGKQAQACLRVQAKLTDFGIGQVLSQEYLSGITRAGFTQTVMSDSSTSHTGTQLYMAPELLAGKPASARSDIYSLGVVLYQLLVGDFSRPLTTDWTKRIDDSLLRDDLALCFAGQPEERFENAGQLAKNLRALPQRQAARREREAALAARAKAAQRWHMMRLAGVGAVILLLGLTVMSILNRNAQVRRARETLPEIAKLAVVENYTAAFALAQQAEKYIANDPVLTDLWSQIAVSVSIATTPPGAEVYFKEYQKPEASWQPLGKSPLNKLRIPRGFYRWQIKKDGYDAVERAEAPTNGPMDFSLDLVGTIPSGMLRVSGGKFKPPIWGMDRLEPVELEDFFIDKFEVSNKQFKEFMDRRGYETTNYWKLPFIKDGKPISRDQAFKEFQDRTGRPGPATWSNGLFPKGQDNYPVSGVSWYEAAAYAEFSGKSLPTLFHWNKAAGTHAVAQIIPFSNFGRQGPAPVGSHRGMSPSGAVDMAGNVGEWIWNEGDSGKRWIAGGAWSDPAYMFVTLDAAAPFNRAPTRGFRCMKTLSGTRPPPATVGPAIPVYRDYKTEKPVSDDVFMSFRGFYAYDKTDLEPKIESFDESSPHWRKEKVTFNAAYGHEKVPGFLFLPKNGSPPYQTIIYFPSATAIQETSSWELDFLEIILQSGRAFFYPVYKGTHERGIGLKTTRQNATSAHRDYIIQISKDFQRSLDYLETRKDIDRDRLGYLGLSWGGRIGTLLLALEGRVKSGVFIIGGLPMEKAYPEVDMINFVTRVKIPILMLNGKFDPVFAVEPSQIPMFQLLGTPEKDKRHVTYELGHQGPPKSELEKEITTWFDRYLGPVK